MKLKDKLFSTLTLLFVIFTFIVWFFTHKESERANELLATKLIQEHSELEKYKTLSPIITEITLVKQLAHEPAIIAMAKDENNPKSRKDGLAILEKYRSQFQDKSYFAVFANSSNYYFNEASSSKKAVKIPLYKLSPTLSKDRWFYDALAMNEPFDINIQTDRVLGCSKVWINYSIKDKGKNIGIIGTGIDFEQFLGNTSTYKQVGERKNYFIKNDLSIQLIKDVHLSNYKSMGQSTGIKLDTLIKGPSDIRHIQEVMKEVSHAKDIHAVRILWVDIQGNRTLLGITYAPEVGWFSLTLFDKKDLSVVDNINIFIMMSILLIITMAVLAFRLNKAIIYPIEKLMQNIDSVKQGELNIDFYITGSIELRELAKRFQSLLREIEERSQLLETIFNSTKESIAIMDKETTFILANNAYSEMLGYSETELYQQTCLGLTHPEDVTIAQNALDTVNVRGYVKHIEKRCLKKDGTIIETNMSVITLPDRDNFLIITNDITEENRLKRERVAQDQQMLQQSRLAQMGEMISMIAHQWRQPLGSIASTALNMKLKLELESFDLHTQEGRDGLNQFFSEKLDNIEHYVENLTTTIDDFRNFYKPDKKVVMTHLTHRSQNLFYNNGSDI